MFSANSYSVSAPGSKQNNTQSGGLSNLANVAATAESGNKTNVPVSMNNNTLPLNSQQMYYQSHPVQPIAPPPQQQYMPMMMPPQSGAPFYDQQHFNSMYQHQQHQSQHPFNNQMFQSNNQLYNSQPHNSIPILQIPVNSVNQPMGMPMNNGLHMANMMRNTSSMSNSISSLGNMNRVESINSEMEDQNPNHHNGSNNNNSGINSHSGTNITTRKKDILLGPSKLRRGPWSQEEDKHLLDLVGLFGGEKNLNWVKISQMLETRTAKQARERYHQNLKPSLNRTPITAEEGKLIEELVERYGKRWAEIARHLNGRSDNAIKNWWNGGANRRKRSSDKKEDASMINHGHEEEVDPRSMSCNSSGNEDDSSISENHNNRFLNEDKNSAKDIEINVSDGNENENNRDGINNSGNISTANNNNENTLQLPNISPMTMSKRSSSIETRLHALNGLGTASNHSKLHNNTNNTINSELSDHSLRKRKSVKDDAISKRRHSAASIGSVGSIGSNGSLPHPLSSTSPYLGLSSFSTNHHPSNIESIISGQSYRSSRASSICSGELNSIVSNISTSDKDLNSASVSRRGSLFGHPPLTSLNNRGSVGSLTGLRRGSANFNVSSFSGSRRESLTNAANSATGNGRLSVTSLTQYSISGNSSSNGNNVNLPFEEASSGLRKDIFKKGFQFSKNATTKQTEKNQLSSNMSTIPTSTTQQSVPLQNISSQSSLPTANVVKPESKQLSYSTSSSQIHNSDSQNHLQLKPSEPEESPLQTSQENEEGVGEKNKVKMSISSLVT